MFNIIQKRGGPYPSSTAGLGGVPTVTTDIPICAILIFLYICFGVTNSTIFQRNRRRNHKFILTIFLAGFSWARVGTLVLRIAWATRPKNIRLAIAAQIFVNAGVLIVYIINLILAQRILRAKHPQIGWNSVIRTIYKVFYITIGVALPAIISTVVVSLYTLNEHTRSICRDIQLATLTYLLIFTCLPIVHVIASVLLPKSNEEESFGEGSMGSKIIIMTVSACLCMLISGFKAGVNWSPPRPALDPAWYDSKACFYVFGFVMEVLILCLLTVARIDKRFYVPNGCKCPGDYTRLRKESPV